MAHKIGFREATSIGVGGILGAGIFVLSGTASASAGPAVLVSFAIAFLASLILGLCYAELSSMHDDSGGPYAYAKAHLSSLAATIVGWANWGAWVCASAYVGIGFGEHLHLLIPAVSAPAAASSLIALFVALNLFGLRVSGHAQFLILVLEVAVLIVFLVVGAAHVDSSLYSPFVAHGWGGVISAALVGFLALTGWDAIVVAAEEIESPRRNIPASILASLGIVFVLYAGLLIILNGLIPARDLGRTNTPVADAAVIFLGPDGRTIVNASIVIALTATTNAFLIVISRTSFVLARDGKAPSLFARTMANGTPWVSIVAAGACQMVMTLLSNLRFAVSATGFLYTITFIASVLALFAARRHGRVAALRVPLYPVVPIAALALCLVFLSTAGLQGSVVGGAWLIGGVVCAAILGRQRARRDHRPDATAVASADI